MKFGTRKILTFGDQRVILMLLHIFISLRIRYTLVKTYALILIFSNTENELCSNKIGAAFFVRSFGCAFFIFRSLRVLFVIVLRAIQDGAKTV